MRGRSYPVRAAAQAASSAGTAGRPRGARLAAGLRRGLRLRGAAARGRLGRRRELRVGRASPAAWSRAPASAWPCGGGLAGSPWPWRSAGGLGGARPIPSRWRRRGGRARRRFAALARARPTPSAALPGRRRRPPPSRRRRPTVAPPASAVAGAGFGFAVRRRFAGLAGAAGDSVAATSARRGGRLGDGGARPPAVAAVAGARLPGLRLRRAAALRGRRPASPARSRAASPRA